jgi:serine protease Do
MRKGEEKAITLTLGELPATREARASTDSRDMPEGEGMRLGLMLAPAASTAGAGNQGVVVTAVDPGSMAAEHGFRTGDVILEVGGKAVSTPADVRKLLTDVRKDGKRTVLMRVKSGEAMKFIAVPLGRA